jgi:nitrogen regulatory protein P-II 1
MKKIEAIFRQSKLTDVVQSLHRHGFDGLTVIEAHGLGRDQSQQANYRGGEAGRTLVPRHRLDLIVDDSLADEAIDAIYQAAHTGEVGDGRITVTNVEATVHIRTGNTIGGMHPVGA